MMRATTTVLVLLLAGAAPFAMAAPAPAARQGDLTTHNGTVTQGSQNVSIAGQPAARQGDGVSCPQFVPGVPPVPHGSGTIVGGSGTVFINGRRAARAGDTISELRGPGSAVRSGQGTVFIN
jgi:uncharacterized Zn-binding protein involved in type VI secretion